MGLIDKDATLKAIADYLRADLADCNHYYLQGAQDVAEVVENMPERGGWIPCSERLPENMSNILVTNGRVALEAYYRDESFIGASIYRPNQPWLCLEISDAIAWQPLPEPWKEAEDEIN